MSVVPSPLGQDVDVPGLRTVVGLTRTFGDRGVSEVFLSFRTDVKDPGPQLFGRLGSEDCTPLILYYVTTTKTGDLPPLKNIVAIF